MNLGQPVPLATFSSFTCSGIDPEHGILQGRIHGLKSVGNESWRARRTRHRRGRVWGGVSPPHREGGYAPPQNFLLIFELKMASFGAFWELILLQLNCQSYTYKPVSLNFDL